MTYQLVFQFRGASLADLDSAVALENELIEELRGLADVDGHDIGSGETNIFVFTSNTAAAFQRARPVLERRLRLQSVTVAYREVKGQSYTVIWPLNSETEFRVT